MKKAIFKFIIVLMVLSIFILADFLAGYIYNAKHVLNESKKFRGESNYISLSTKVISPDINHKYRPGYRNKNIYDGNISEPRFFTTNSNGEIIGKTIAKQHSYNILFFGGSTTECNEVDAQYRFPYLTGKLLADITNKNIEGVNIGVRGNTVHDSLNILLNHTSTEDSKIIILMHNINDRLFLSHSGNYETILNKNMEYNWHSIYNLSLDYLSNLWDRLTYESNILFIIRTDILNYNPWTGETNIKFKNSENEITFINNNSVQSKKSYKENLILFVSSVKAMGKTPILMTQLLGQYSAEQEEYNEIVREVANMHSILLIDIEKELKNDAHDLFLSDNIHLNNKGSRAIADTISSFIGAHIFNKAKLNAVKNKNKLISFDKCKPVPKNVTFEDIKLGKKNLLLSRSGRYPVLSKDMKYLSYQKWTGSKEIVEILNVENSQTTTISNRNGSTSDRHAIFIENNKKIYSIMARKNSTKSREFLVSSDIKNNEHIKILPIPSNLSASIPEYLNNNIYFAGSVIENNGKYIGIPDLYMMDINNGNLKQLTNTASEEWRPAPDPIGKYVYYIKYVDDNFDIFRINTFNKKEELFFSSPVDEWDPNISLNNKWVIFSSKKNDSWDLIISSSKDPKKYKFITNDEYDNWDPRFISTSNVIIYAASLKENEPHMYYQCLFGENSN